MKEECATGAPLIVYFFVSMSFVADTLIEHTVLTVDRSRT